MKISDVPSFAQREFKQPTNPLLIGLLLLTTVIAVVVMLTLVTRSLIALTAPELPSLNAMNRGVAFFDRNDHYVRTVHEDKDREVVPLDKISTNMRKAIIAAEDHRFYQHLGIDLFGIARAMFINHREGRIVEGASTITQQLVRNLYLDPSDRSLSRKIKEASLAIGTEQRYSKSKILETYLNEAYFGGGAYGVERAAEHFFNKRASELNIPESAFLAGLVRSPSTLGSAAGRKQALERQQLVLDQMAEFDLLSKAEATQAKHTALAFRKGRSTTTYDDYLSYALQTLQKELGSDMWKHRWKVYTNLDVAAQRDAERILERGIKNAPYGINEGALVTLNVKDGALLAMVGSVDDKNEWNRALYPHTAGSAFKPFVYLAGLTQGVLYPDTLVDDAPLSIDMGNAKAYEPKNFDGHFMGWLPAAMALAYSRNTCSVRVAQQAGIERVIEVAHSAGIKSQLDPFPSLALGSCAVTPLEMASAYSTFARKGAYMEPQVIRRIQDADGRMVKTFQTAPSVNLDQESVAELVQALQDVVRSGTGTQAALAGIPVAGKTGTADKAKDLWFVGFTPDTVTAVWGGNDKNRDVRGGHSVTGGAVMARIWHDYVTAFYQKHRPDPQLAFDRPAYRLLEQNVQYDQAALIANRDPYAEKPVMNRSAALDPTQASQIGIIRAFDAQRAEALGQLASLNAPPAAEESPDSEGDHGFIAEAVAPIEHDVESVTRTFEHGRTRSVVQSIKRKVRNVMSFIF